MAPETPEPKEKTVMLTELLETSWSKLPPLLSSLPLREQWKFALRIADGNLLSLVLPWEKILDAAVAKEQIVAREQSFPARELTETDARVYMMTVPGSGHNLFYDLLKTKGVYTVEDRRISSTHPGAMEFRTCMMALNASLPHNRNGSNPVTVFSIGQQVVEKGLGFIRAII